ncbi:uncharacterized protein LOC113531045 isoform X4 [Pangasianodon hypophthalmus]|uniref:uncharacterized protein LOC113531045 isoform X4 n=1 Tax=Pangasianodon hypophthalmus TaxID=310915 RepID=UPI0023076454|nr:uncharacterized protein LOC113531045 isoform X4 [Pangasianodon hypophthalmus]
MSHFQKLQLNDRMMVLHFSSICFSVWMLWRCLKFVKGGELCQNQCIDKSNISAELQSDVLLPCNFNPALLGSDKTADIAVVWRQRNTTIHNLVEITLQGVAKFWNYKGGRIKAFPKLSESGNFSILLQKVQPYDLSLYHCELFNGTNCSIAYQELQLGCPYDNPIYVSYTVQLSHGEDAPESENPIYDTAWSRGGSMR